MNLNNFLKDACNVLGVIGVERVDLRKVQHMESTY
jgi:hypothetical protein